MTHACSLNIVIHAFVYVFFKCDIKKIVSQHDFDVFENNFQNAFVLLQST